VEKMITLRFSARCKQCKQEIPSGSSAYWLGSGKGARHLHCPVPAEIDKPGAKNELPRFVTDFHTLRTDFNNALAGDLSSLKRDGNKARLRTMIDQEWTMSRDFSSVRSFFGCSVNEMKQWLSEGYAVEGLADVQPSLVPARPRRKLFFNEEGDELLIDLVYQGDDNPFMTVEKRPTKPGMRVDVHLDFNADFPARTIFAYERWIARMLHTLDENAIDVEVNVIMVNQGLIRGKDYEQSEISIRVKKAGEAADFSSWSSMFSPGGYRMLGFMSIIQAADYFGGTVTNGLGSAVSLDKWTVAYDDAENVLQIGQSDDSRTDFPEFEMTEKLRAVLAKVNG
jgi:hypothetical protein